MALADVLDLTQKRKKIGVSEERITAVLPIVRKYIALWREYPDLFVDFMAGPDSTFHLFFYQRVFLRAAVRHKYMYAVYPRAYSKSFLAVLALMVRCILFPRAKLFVTSGGKQQAAGIIEEKVREICQLVPAFDKEIDYGPKKTTFSKDYVRVVFKNESYFDNIAANEKSRGKRRHAGVLEECVSIDGDILSEVILPIMNVSRSAVDGHKDPEEALSQSQLYITTAGFKNTFPYAKLIQLLVWEIIEPHKSCVLGGTWRIPVLMGLQPKNFISEMKRDGTFNDTAFDREYESKWAGSVENAFFRADVFDRNRILLQPEYEFSGRSAKSAYYILAVDVGRKGCDTVVTVIKVTPSSQDRDLKTIVNIYTFTDEHFEDQCIKIKRLYYKYKARRIVLDANGLGIGLLDYFVKSQVDAETDEYFPDFGVYNDDEGYYKKFRTSETEHDAIFALKANAPINTEAHSILQAQLSSGRIKFLIDEKTAKNKLMGTARGEKMNSEERAEYLKPFTLTSILREELLNLREENEGINIILKQANKNIRKDKFSSLEYGIYYIKNYEEDTKKKKKKFNAAEWRFYN